MAMMNEMEYRTIGSALAGGYRAAVYCRLSKDDDLQGESASIANQRDMLEKYCEKQGWEVVAVYQDDGFTGLNMERPDLQRMLRAIERRQINLVITKDEYEILGLNLKSQLNQGFRGLVLFLLTLKIADKAIHRRQYEQNEYFSAKRGAASLCSARTCHTLPTYILDRRSTELSAGVDLYRYPLRYSTHVPLARAT